MRKIREVLRLHHQELNHRKFKKLEGTRYEAFEKTDKPAMRPLPVLRFELAERETKRANIDHHVDFDCDPARGLERALALLASFSWASAQTLIRSANCSPPLIISSNSGY
jgi:hypothetical protein